MNQWVILTEQDHPASVDAWVASAGRPVVKRIEQKLTEMHEIHCQHLLNSAIPKGMENPAIKAFKNLTQQKRCC